MTTPQPSHQQARDERQDPTGQTLDTAGGEDSALLRYFREFMREHPGAEVAVIDLKDSAQARAAFPGQAGDTAMRYKLYRDQIACDSDDFGPPHGQYSTLALAMTATGLPVSAWHHRQALPGTKSSPASPARSRWTGSSSRPAPPPNSPRSRRHDR